MGLSFRKQKPGTLPQTSLEAGGPTQLSAYRSWKGDESGRKPVINIMKASYIVSSQPASLQQLLQGLQREGRVRVTQSPLPTSQTPPPKYPGFPLPQLNPLWLEVDVCLEELTSTLPTAPPAGFGSSQATEP